MTEKHYCFNTGRIDGVWGRVHVPLAKKCTLHCVYCNYRTDGNITQDIWRPGTAADTVEGYDGIYEYLNKALKTFPDVRIIGVSGPGDPLENMPQMHDLVSVMQEHFPHMYLCLCTNGSIYDEEVQWLLEQPLLRYITLTINTMDTDKYPKIYHRYSDPRVRRDMWANQLEIIRTCVRNGIKVKVNTVCLQGVNNLEIMDMFARLQQEGVSCLNLMPRIDAKNGMIDSPETYRTLLDKLLYSGFPLMTRCRHCRADHCECGIKGGNLP